MQTKLSTINAALARLGERPLTSLAEDGPIAVQALSIYDAERDMAFAAHPWHFAARTVTLTQAPGTPPDGWETQWLLPADLMRLLAVYLHPRQPTQDFALHDARRLLWRWEAAHPPVITYVARIGENDWPAWFRVYVELRLAHALCLGLTESVEKTDAMERQVMAAFRAARLHNAQSRPSQLMDLGAFTRSRRF
jgi:hypothetical protein